MMKNKIFFLTIFIFLAQCGYQTIYSNKNSNFNIVEIKIINDQNIGRQIKNRLSVLSNADKNSENYLCLVLYATSFYTCMRFILYFVEHYRD